MKDTEASTREAVWEPEWRRGEPVELAITAAGRYLLAKQSADGAWRDFLTEPGVADAWTTAYVGLCLLTLPRDARTGDWQPSLERAANWLAGQINRFSGWGYNAKCPPDADSTAHAILFLRHCGVGVPLQAYRRLLSFGRPDGGFATYLVPSAEDSWGISHPCVTPVVIHALLTCLACDAPPIVRSIEYIRVGQEANGMWHSFWWSTPLYSTAVNLQAAVELGLDIERTSLTRSLEALRLDTSFDLALLLRCLASAGQLAEAARVTESLLRLQEPTGGWPSSPILRVTRRSCFAPWHERDPGILYADQECLFTTATALRSLADWHRDQRSSRAEV
jgi:hypothetical protein